jgi:SAM-dependent methyltransferase
MSDAETRGRQRAVWAAGDLPDIATTIVDVADVLIDAVDPQPVHHALDVATGTGNVAIPLAQRGARVVGLDITPELFDSARRRAAKAGVEIDWIEGDAEELPFEDEAFDVVTSSFGAMFAPNHAQAAQELARVTRPGGRIAFTAWTPEGVNGRMFAVMGRHMPPPPAGFQPPTLWGNEEHVRALLGDRVSGLRFERGTAVSQGESADAWVDYLGRVLGPVVVAKAALERQGAWGAARADLVALFEQFNTATDGTLYAPAEYLLTVATK